MEPFGVADASSPVRRPRAQPGAAGSSAGPVGFFTGSRKREPQLCRARPRTSPPKTEISLSYAWARVAFRPQRDRVRLRQAVFPHRLAFTSQEPQTFAIGHGDAAQLPLPSAGPVRGRPNNRPTGPAASAIATAARPPPNRRIPNRSGIRPPTCRALDNLAGSIWQDPLAQHRPARMQEIQLRRDCRWVPFACTPASNRPSWTTAGGSAAATLCA